jgi:hypothetical protein
MNAPKFWYGVGLLALLIFIFNINTKIGFILLVTTAIGVFGYQATAHTGVFSFGAKK